MLNESSPNDDLNITTNCHLEKAVSFLPSGGLRRTANQLLLMEYEIVFAYNFDSTFG